MYPKGLFRLARHRQFDGVKQCAGFGTRVSQSEHSDRPRHGVSTAACVGFRSIIDALVKQDVQGNQPIRSRSHVSNVKNDNRMMSAVNGMSAMRAQRVAV